MHFLGMKVVRIRGLIIEALAQYLITYGTPIGGGVLNTILKSADVIEHIAQDAVCGVSNAERARRLIADLDGSELILKQFEDELNKSRMTIPSLHEIQQLREDVYRDFNVV